LIMSDTEKIDITATLPSSLNEGPEWLKTRRVDSLHQFNNTPLPKRGLHLWRYTDPARFLTDPSIQQPATKQFDTSSIEDSINAQVNSNQLSAFIVEQDGEISSHSIENLLSLGITIESITEAAARDDQRVSKHLYELVSSNSGKFEAQNSALWQGGVFIHIPRGVVVKEPIYLLRKLADGGITSYLRLLIVAEENSEFTIIDDYVGGAEPDSGEMSYSNIAVEIFGGANSHLRYVSLQNLNNGSRSYLTHRARIDRDATMLTVPMMFGGSECKQNFGILLAGNGARSNIIGLQMAQGYQNFDTHTLHHHTANNTFSDIDLKVVLKDKANSAYTGLIRIDESAAGCEAYQTNRNLLLNYGCKAQTIPELEILNEDVSCSHGATVGPVDQESIFYLKCRGIEEDEAVRMLVAGFVDSTMTMLPKDISPRIKEIVQTRLKGI